MSNKRIQEEVNKQIAKLVPILTEEITKSIIENINDNDGQRYTQNNTKKSVPRSLIFTYNQLNSMRFNEIKDVADNLGINVINETKPDYVNSIMEFYRDYSFKNKDNDRKKISKKVSDKIKSRLVTYDESIGYYTSTYNNVRYVYDIKTNSIVGKIVKGTKCVPLSPNEAKQLRNMNFNLYHVNELKRSVMEVLSKNEINKVLNGKNLKLSRKPPELSIDDDFYEDCDYTIDDDDDDEDGDDIIIDGDYDYDIIDDTEIEIDEVFNNTVHISDSEFLKYRNVRTKHPTASLRKLSDLTGIKIGKIKYMSANYGHLMNKYKRKHKNPRY